jgi:hypothetical protein
MPGIVSLRTRELAHIVGNNSTQFFPLH